MLGPSFVVEASDRVRAGIRPERRVHSNRGDARNGASNVSPDTGSIRDRMIAILLALALVAGLWGWIWGLAGALSRCP